MGFFGCFFEGFQKTLYFLTIINFFEPKRLDGLSGSNMSIILHFAQYYSLLLVLDCRFLNVRMFRSVYHNLTGIDIVWRVVILILYGRIRFLHKSIENFALWRHSCPHRTFAAHSLSRDNFGDKSTQGLNMSNFVLALKK